MLIDECGRHPLTQEEDRVVRTLKMLGVPDPDVFALSKRGKTTTFRVISGNWCATIAVRRNNLCDTIWKAWRAHLLLQAEMAAIAAISLPV